MFGQQDVVQSPIFQVLLTTLLSSRSIAKTLTITLVKVLSWIEDPFAK